MQSAVNWRKFKNISQKNQNGLCLSLKQSALERYVSNIMDMWGKYNRKTYVSMCPNKIKCSFRYVKCLMNTKT